MSDGRTFTDIKIVNMKTGEVWKVDYYAIKERGMPDGFKDVEEVTKDELIEILLTTGRKP